MAPMTASEPVTVEQSIRQHVRAGAIATLLLVVGVGGWATLANLSGAVVASGHFVVDSYVKKVQHPVGGVVGEILVSDGSKVRAGDVVMRLDATQTRAGLAIVTKRLDELQARQARLNAERDDLAEIQFPEDLLKRRTTTDVAAAISSEERLFAFRRELRAGKKAQLLERIAQFEHEIAGLKAQEVAYGQGIDVLQAEITNLDDLHRKGAVSTERLNTLKTQLATFGGERGEKIAYQAETAGRIAEARLQILQINQDLKTEVSTDLRDVQAQIGEYVERKVAADDALKRIDITAPQSGIVHQLTAHTVGGVVNPAEPVMLIVPEGDDLTLDVMVQPKDIDQIYTGQTAVLRLVAFNTRTTPEVNGQVARIAADLSVDEKSGLSYYLVRIAVSQIELQKLQGLKLLPGMPAEAMIQTGERSALSYLVKPMSDQINRAFREE